MNIFRAVRGPGRGRRSAAWPRRGKIPAGPRRQPRRRRAAARRRAWRPRDQRRDGAGQGGAHESARARRAHRRPTCSERPARRQGRGGGARLHQPQAPARACTRRCCAPCCRHGKAFGRGEQGAAAPVNVEFVSANPTGPMHVGPRPRARCSAMRSPNLLAFAGHRVTREYYINDAGAQVDVLARSAYPALPRGARRGRSARSRRGSTRATT